jgi:CheY-like chemotaxis protein
MKKVLVIDDDADIREIVKLTLQDAYELREAGSAMEGEEVLKGWTPDLILLDVMMESSTAGFDVARAIKGKPGLAGAKILMVTSVDKELGIDFQSAAGDPDWLPVDGYLVKPIDPGDLRRKITALLG